ncbi:alcohol oxidase [Guyanagaster necrorhizus]|uniref:Alcohol oxidase n=1 Tax=Guyanagaster necrorhizus TaxID=856835 RepID=A0A9P7VUV4_9AGAR|nr:alcohol oxidase [Guyanagaster necrorhizus MCA 3950]KAG7446564.1 alcohol oxidase [Guyanagaster necrorhizus MCA 3950]
MPIVPTAVFLAVQFDYLIVGGGTSGLCVAARLSEDKSVLVGVLEAGSYDSDLPEIAVPGLVGRTMAHPVYDWTFFSEPQVHANGRSILQSRGKGLGTLRPSKEELNALEELGNKGWNWNSLLESMKKSEHTLQDDFRSDNDKMFSIPPDPEFHGHGGPIIKSLFPASIPPIHAALFDAAENLGVARCAETGHGVVLGSMPVFTTIDTRTATRSYAASGYYKPNAGRSNLLILTEAQATKVILEDQEDGRKKAVGVEFIKNGNWLSSSVRKEVILSAGSFQSPQLLELSGIGNPEILNTHGIKTLINLPEVGENLQDHTMVFTIAEVDETMDTMELLLDPQQQRKHAELYKNQRGMLASVPTSGSIFLEPSKLGNAEELHAWRDLAESQCSSYLSSIRSPGLKRGIQKQYKLQREWFSCNRQAEGEIIFFNGHYPSAELQPKLGKRYLSLSAALMHPFSRGTVHIKSANPLDPPAIDPNYFANDADVEMTLRILKLAFKLQETAPLCDVIKERDENLKGYIKNMFSSVFHPVGTAAMMSRELGGVVDDKLIVYGTSNLRVVDLSILPMELACHTQSIAYAIGEKWARGNSVPREILLGFGKESSSLIYDLMPPFGCLLG